MARYSAFMDWFGADGSVGMKVPCFIDFDSNRIVVTYDVDGRGRSYSGQDIGHGHFKLNFDYGIGWASLHCFPPDGAGQLDEFPRKFEGSFVEEGYPGMWRIELIDKVSTL